jgi:hypothetical protein
LGDEDASGQQIDVEGKLVRPFDAESRMVACYVSDSSIVLLDGELQPGDGLPLSVPVSAEWHSTLLVDEIAVPDGTRWVFCDAAIPVTASLDGRGFSCMLDPSYPDAFIAAPEARAAWQAFRVSSSVQGRRWSGLLLAVRA